MGFRLPRTPTHDSLFFRVPLGLRSSSFCGHKTCTIGTCASLCPTEYLDMSVLCIIFTCTGECEIGRWPCVSTKYFSSIVSLDSAARGERVQKRGEELRKEDVTTSVWGKCNHSVRSKRPAALLDRLASPYQCRSSSVYFTNRIMAWGQALP